MSAPAETTPAQSTPAGRGPSPRRHGAATRQVGAAGQTRRTLQRDLARREASLRISRRVSGPSGGVVRPALAESPVALPQRPPSVPAPPVVQPRQAAPAPTPQAGVDLRGGGLEVPAFAQAPTIRRRAVAARQSPAARAAARPAAQQVQTAMAAPVASRPATVAAAAALAPARLPLQLPSRPRLTALPGGLVETAPAGKRRLSTPAVMVAAITIVILTFGAILGLQIRKTQVNERMGADLSAISQLQQKVTATREKVNRTIAATNVDGAARKGGLFEPDLTDVRFVRVGSAAQSAERAKRLLEKAPVAPAGGAAKTAPSPASSSVQGSSGAAASMGAVSGQTTGSAATAPSTNTAGAGAVQ